jgi:cysteine desulfurase
MRIYLDHNATTPLRPEVVDAMATALRERWGNPSSTHAEGAAARNALERAREQVAELVGAAPREVIFTSGATEANNLVLHGALSVALGRGRGRHIVTSTVEHPSVEEPLRALEEEGAAVTRVPVDRDGRLDPEAVAVALRDDTALLSVILANNETGVVQDAAKLAERAHARGIPVHFDATQAVGKQPLDAVALGADLLSGTAHKLNGPKGAGFLVDRSHLPLPPLLRGGPQERRRRGGTENVAGIVGLGVACALARAELADRHRHVSALRDALWRGIEARVPCVRRNGDPAHVLPNTLSVEFEGANGEVLLEALDLEGVAVSGGAACHSGSIEPSGVLLAMGRTPAQARGTLRFSVGPSNTAAEIERVLELLPPLVARVREAGA